MADMLPVHQFLLDTMTEYFDAHGGPKLFDNKVPNGEEIPTMGASGMVAPHACLMLGDPDEHPQGRDLSGAVNALGLVTFEVLCVAGSAIQLTQMRDLVVRCLIGAVLPDGSEISSNGSLAVGNAVTTLVTPQRYYRVLGFWASVGATVAV